MSIDSMYLNGEKYIKDRALTWTKYHSQYTARGIADINVDYINLLDGTVHHQSTYWEADSTSIFAVSDPFKLTVGSQTYTMRLLAYPQDIKNGRFALSTITEETFETEYQNKYQLV